MHLQKISFVFAVLYLWSNEMKNRFLIVINLLFEFLHKKTIQEKNKAPGRTVVHYFDKKQKRSLFCLKRQLLRFYRKLWLKALQIRKP